MKMNLKHTTIVTLITLILASALLASCLVPLQAVPWSINLEATVTTNPYWGYYGGYHDIWYTIQPELAKIGINVALDMYDEFTWWDQVWEEGWNHTGDTAYPPGGWDMTILEWWLQPHALDPWFSSMVYSWMWPPEGYNIHPWSNEKADDYLWKGMTTFDASDRKKYLWDWQEEFMHDPPWANIYYPLVYEVTGRYVEGYDPTGCWFYDVSHLAINTTALPPELNYSPRNETLIYAVSEPLWNLLPLFTETYTEEQMTTLQWNTLYVWSIDPWPPTGTSPGLEDYKIKPELASDYPTYLVGPNGPDTRVRVPLRHGVLWSDGRELNASDVKLSFDLTLTTHASGMGDYAYILDDVVIVDEYTVDFLLKAPCPDIISVLSNDWGGGLILPWHHLKGVSPPNIKGLEANYDTENPSAWFPVTGPFKLKAVTPEHLELERNPDYFGYDLGWGPYGVETIILKWVPDPGVRLAEMKTNTIDFGEYPTAPVEVYHDLMDEEKWPYLRVWQYNYPASNPIWFNFDNPYLSNRYVRQAIAHAVPYDLIISDKLQSWGIETAYQGKTYIMPTHYYTDPSTSETVHLYNDDLEPFENNITKAEMYMNMWYYSQEGTDHTLGPVGDADFSGVVRLDDFILWATNFGTEPADWTFLPGNDIDPDFDNSGTVNLDDFIEWAANYGAYYPFEGAR